MSTPPNKEMNQLTEYTKTALVLGGTAPHIALIERLRARGFKTLLLDYTPNPPAKDHADEHIQESTMDEAMVLQVARERNVDLVISACVDQANVTACYVGEALGLPIPYSHATSLRVSNKVLMKEGMLRTGVDTSRFMHARSVDQVNESGLRFPLMVKPADSCSSNAVKKAEDVEQARQYFTEAEAASRTGEVIIEEFVTGREISVYGFVHDGRVSIIMMAERHSVIEGDDHVLKCYCTTSSPALSAVALERIQVNSDRIVKEFELDNTPIHIQVLLEGDQVNVIEFAPRVGGGMSYYTILKNTGFDIINSAIDSFLGNQVQLVQHPPARFYAISLVYADSGVLGAVNGMESLMKDGLVEKFGLYKRPGDKISVDRASRSRIGAAIISGRDRKDLLDRIAQVTDRVDILDEKGNSIHRKDLSLPVLDPTWGDQFPGQ